MMPATCYRATDRLASTHRESGFARATEHAQSPFDAIEVNSGSGLRQKQEHLCIQHHPALHNSKTKGAKEETLDADDTQST